MSIKIGNIGTVNAPSGKGNLYIWIDDQLKWTYSLSGLYSQDFLLPNGSTVVQPQVLVGQHKIKATIDPNNVITESEETNNTLEATVVFGTASALPYNQMAESLNSAQKILQQMLEGLR